MLGNGNHDSHSGATPSGVSEPMVPAFHGPMNSMAAVWLAIRPFELSAPVWAGVARKPSLNGSVARKSSRFSPASIQHSSSNSRLAIDDCSTSVGQEARANWYHQWPAGHRSPAPTAIGETPMSFSWPTASSSSSSVSGVPSMPACSNSSVLYQMPVTPKENGMPYCLPSTSPRLDDSAVGGDLVRPAARSDP